MEPLWKPRCVKFLPHAVCLPGQSKLCFMSLQKLGATWKQRSRGSGVELTMQSDRMQDVFTERTDMGENKGLGHEVFEHLTKIQLKSE